MCSKGKSKKKTRSQVSVQINKNRSSLYASILVFALAFLTYANTLNHGYALDDSIAITSNIYTSKGFAGIPDLLQKDLFEGAYGEQLEVTGGRYRPLSLIFFAAEHQIFNKNASAHHFFNVLYYSILCLLIFYFLKEIFQSISIALIASILFAVHPLHTEVVANIKSRDEIFCLLFMMLSLLGFLKFNTSQELKYLAAALFSFLLALLSKELAVILLIITPLTIYIFRDLNLKKQFPKYILPSFVLFIIYFIIRSSLVGMPGGSDSLDIMENPYIYSGFHEKYATVFLILGKYLKLMFLPFPLSSDYSFNQIPIQAWSVLSVLSVMVYVAIGLFAFYGSFKKNHFAYACLWYLLPFGLTSNFFFNIGAPMGERFAFVSSLGFILIIALGFNKFFHLPTKELKFKPIPWSIVIVLAIAYFVISVQRNPDWKNNKTLFSNDVNVVPNSAKVHYYYANVLLNEYQNSKNEESLNIAHKHFKRSAMIAPSFHWAQFNLAKTYDQKNQSDSAIIRLNKVLERYPTHIATQSMLGNIYGKKLNDYPKAEFYLSKAIEYGDRSKGVYHNLGIVYALSGKYEQSIQSFRTALELSPNDPAVLNDLGLTYLNAGNEVEGRKLLNKAERLKNQGHK